MLAENEARLNEAETSIAELEANLNDASRMAHSLEFQLEETQKQLKVPSCEIVTNLKDLVAQSSAEVFRLNKEVSSLEIKLKIIERRHL